MAAGDISRGIKWRVRLRVGDAAGTSVLDSEIYAWLSEAQLEIAARQPEATIPALCGYQSWTSATTPALVLTPSAYALPAGFMWPRLLTYNSYPVSLIDVEEVAKRGAGLSLATSKTTGLWWIWNDQFHVDMGTNDLQSTDTMDMFYVKQAPQYNLGGNTSGNDAPPMAPSTGAMSDSVDPLTSPMYFPAMEDYAVARCMEQRGFYSSLTFLMGQFDAKLQIVAARFRTQDPLKPESVAS